MDDRKQRYIITDDGADGLGFMGWEVEAHADLDTLAARAGGRRHAVEPGSGAIAEQRRVTDLITFADPGGNRLEVLPGSRSSPIRRSFPDAQSPASSPVRSAWATS